jgi:hypothetical protein
MKTTTVILNDIHAGSEYAVKAPKDSLNSSLPLNNDQVKLYDFWCGLVKRWRNPDNLILNGDLVDGLAFKSNLSDCWTRDLTAQAQNCLALIRQFAAKKIFVIRGTPYHTQTKGFDVEEYIAGELKAELDGVRRSTELKLINIAPKGAPTRIVHVAHHLNGSQWFNYRGTALSRDMSAVMLNESHFIDRIKHQKISGIIRAHNHYFWYMESASRFMLSAPAWQLTTPFMFKTSPSSAPDIGAVRMIVDENGDWLKQHALLHGQATKLIVHNEE